MGFDDDTLRGHKALVHLTAADLHGALQEYDQAIAIEAINSGGPPANWPMIWLLSDMNKAIAVSDLGDASRGGGALRSGDCDVGALGQPGRPPRTGP